MDRLAEALRYWVAYKLSSDQVGLIYKLLLVMQLFLVKVNIN